MLSLRLLLERQLHIVEVIHYPLSA